MPLERAGIATTLPECTLRPRLDAKPARTRTRDAVHGAHALFAPYERIATRASARAADAADSVDRNAFKSLRIHVLYK